MAPAELDELVADLRRRGLDAEAREVADVCRALDALERPPGVLQRLGAAAREEAATQWRHAVGEWEETCTAVRIVRERLVSGRALRADEAEAVRAQTLDLLRTVPAGVVAAATALVPVPGAMLLTPWLLRRLGLLPSRWREDALLAVLRRQEERLRAKNEVHAAERMAAVAARVEERRRTCDAADRRSADLTAWDVDGDGTFSAQERAAYDAAVARAADAARRDPTRRAWYARFENDVAGPFAWQDVAGGDADVDVLVCLDGECGWLRRADVLAAALRPS